MGPEEDERAQVNEATYIPTTAECFLRVRVNFLYTVGIENCPKKCPPVSKLLHYPYKANFRIVCLSKNPPGNYSTITYG